MKLDRILRFTSALLCRSLILSTLFAVSRLHGQMSSTASTASSIPQEDPILKRGFKSWTVFLASNLEWVLAQDENQLANVQRRFFAFGDAIGPDHLAVWLLEDRDKRFLKIDVERGVYFCKKLGLKPSDGPFLITTSRYPGKCVMADPESFPTSTKDMIVLRVGDTDAEKFAQMLAKLLDAVVTSDLSALRKRDAPSWSVWRAIFSSLTGVVIGMSESAAVTIDGGLVKTEIKLAGEKQPSR